MFGRIWGPALECRDVNMDTELIHIWENKEDRPRSIPMTARVKQLLQPRKLGFTCEFKIKSELISRRQ
jgi:hypothetical protein